MAQISDLQVVTVYRDPEGRWNGAFPEVACLGGGTLVVSLRQAPFPPTGVCDDPPRPHAHGDPRARGAVIRSTDGGQSWPLATLQVLADPEGGVEQNSVSAISGDFLLAPYAARTHLHARGNVWVRRSADGGQTWDQSTPMDANPLCYAAVHAPMLELPDGTILSPHCGAIGNRDAKQHALVVVRSRDRGHTWGDGTIVALDPSGATGYHQASLVRRADGEIITAMHSAQWHTEADGQEWRMVGLWLSRSFDDRRSWTPLEQAPLRLTSAAHHLLGLRDGRLLCVWGRRDDPSIRAAVSDDGGHSWDTTRGWPLRQGEHFMDARKPRALPDGRLVHRLLKLPDGRLVDMQYSDIGEPCSTQLPDGRVVSVYYWGERKDAPLWIEAAIYTVRE